MPARTRHIGRRPPRLSSAAGASTTTLFLPASARSYQFPFGEGQRVFVRVIADTVAGPSPPSNEVQIDGDRLAGCVGLTTGAVVNGVSTLLWAPAEHGCLVAGYQMQAGPTAGATETTCDLPATVRRFEGNAVDTPPRVWFVRVARIPNRD